MNRHEQLAFFFSEYGPLIKKPAVAAALQCSEDHVLTLLDEGRLRAVNIALRTRPYDDPETGREITPLRELRFYRGSVSTFMDDPSAPLIRVPIEAMLPPIGPDMSRIMAAKTLDCDVTHVARLPLPVARYGALKSNRMPRIDRAGFVEFLIDREVRS